jgi:hypothetical protein
MKEKVVEGGGKGGLRAKQETQRRGKEEGREDYGPSRKHNEGVGVRDNTRGAGEGRGARRKKEMWWR